MDAGGPADVDNPVDADESVDTADQNDTGTDDASTRDVDTSDGDAVDSTDASGAECMEGRTRDCGPSTGACVPGEQTCTDGEWGECTGGTGPVDEECNGKDDTCDGTVDEGCDCTSGETRSCGQSTGQCQTGNQECVDGEWQTTCKGNTAPSTESCDGADNDCDGSTDEGLSRSCGQSTGQCQTGTETCDSGSWGSCQNNIEPSMETCDGDDNDCDGSIDEGVQRTCGQSIGQCETGTETCNNGSWGSCQDNTEPSMETCDGDDNDCDGSTDEVLSRSCGQSTGQCETGTETCSGGSWGSCQNNVGPSDETCDGNDNDCDGSVDELTRGLGETCNFQCECANGRTCVSDGDGDDRCAHRVFATSDTYRGDRLNAAGPDWLCSNAAADANLGGTWKAIISFSTPSASARSRISASSPIAGMNGDKIANDETDLWSGSLQNGIRYDEYANSISLPAQVWTGTDATGAFSPPNCTDWSDAQSSGLLGSVGTTTSNWIESGNTGSCTLTRRLYCIEQK